MSTIIAKLNDNYTVANTPNQANVESLAQQGFKSIVDLRADTEDENCGRIAAGMICNI